MVLGGLGGGLVGRDFFQVKSSAQPFFSFTHHRCFSSNKLILFFTTADLKDPLVIISG